MRQFKLTLMMFGLGLLAWQSVTLVKLPTAHAQATAEQAMVDLAFEPVEIVVGPGTTVVWPNRGQTIHVVASLDMSWTSTTLQPGESYSYTFEAPGSYQIWCPLHSAEMVGTVIVQ
jgi:plastocyanin